MEGACSMPENFCQVPERFIQKPDAEASVHLGSHAISAALFR